MLNFENVLHIWNSVSHEKARCFTSNLYEDDHRSVDAWNAVDVEVDGMLQHGHVIDIQDSDPLCLIVDFGCPSQQSVSVEYGRAFGCSSVPADERPKVRKKKRAPELTEYPDMQALLRACPDQPWIWYPARIIIPRLIGLANFVIVEATLAGQVIREILPRVQIRPSPSASELRSRIIQLGHFFITLNSLGDRYLTVVTDKPIPSDQGREGEQQCVLIAYLRYMQRRRNNLAKTRNAAVTGEFCHVSETDDGMGTMSGAWERGLLLPVVLLAEVFQSMDSIHRQQCRRVCRLWGDIIISPLVAQHFTVALPTPVSNSADYGRDRNVNYVTYSCILKQITSATRTICLRDNDYNRHEVVAQLDSDTLAGQTMQYIQQILQNAGIRINRLVLYRRSMQMNRRYSLAANIDDTVELYSSLASCCDHIIWKECQLGRDAVTFNFPRTVISLDCVNASGLWETFDRHIASTGRLDLEGIVQWTSGAIREGNKEHKRKLIQWPVPFHRSFRNIKSVIRAHPPIILIQNGL
ncbi:uncharacterized protein LOC129599557 isoform X2 [Paramacrobiotus metropolitanus]|uniref:uncharacterized protein LOC129599557 isoform X2 n=1 Tax=Paramacrobiotus metropolitanus TaxID=2943436 RepID=UPI00244581D2|nr:uncharacterized protein LOC129599557 isoform X2 [Paramacrobiotus metropolitanus]